MIRLAQQAESISAIAAFHLERKPVDNVIINNFGLLELNKSGLEMQTLL